MLLDSANSRCRKGKPSGAQTALHEGSQTCGPLAKSTVEEEIFNLHGFLHQDLHCSLSSYTQEIHSLFFFFFNFMYLFMAVLGLRFCARAFSNCGKLGRLFIAVRGPLTIAASLAAEHRLQTRRLSNCGSRAQPLRGTWDLLRPGLEPMSPSLAGRFSATAPPGKPHSLFYVTCLAPEFIGDPLGE